MSPPSFLELQRQQFPAVLPEGKCPVALSPRLASPPIPAGLHQQLQRSSPDRRRFCRSRIPYPEIPVPWLPQVAAAATSTRLAPNPSRSPRRLPHPAHHDRHGTPESDPAARPRMSCPVPPISTGFRFASRAHQKTRSAPARRTSAGRHLWNPPTFFCRRLLCAPGTPRFRPHAPCLHPWIWGHGIPPCLIACSWRSTRPELCPPRGRISRPACHRLSAFPAKLPASGPPSDSPRARSFWAL